MADTPATASLPASSSSSNTNPALTGVGFLTVLNDGGGYLGGYLVTNTWGRPLEFRLTSAVQPNKVQQILYASTLSAYVCADLIGKTLVDKTGTPAQLIITDCETVLELRHKVEMPVLYLLPSDDPRATSGRVLGHPRFPADTLQGQELLTQLDSGFDLSEPFQRIREAVGEARKMGVTNR